MSTMEDLINNRWARMLKKISPPPGDVAGIAAAIRGRIEELASQHLTSVQYQVWDLYMGHGKTLKQIAEDLDRGEGTIAATLHGTEGGGGIFAKMHFIAGEDLLCKELLQQLRTAGGNEKSFPVPAEETK